MEMMVPSLPPSGKCQALLQTSVHGEEDEAIIVVGSNGAVGSRMSGSHYKATVKGGKWHTVHVTVCSNTLTVTTFVDGMVSEGATLIQEQYNHRLPVANHQMPTAKLPIA